MSVFYLMSLMMAMPARSLQAMRPVTPAVVFLSHATSERALSTPPVHRNRLVLHKHTPCAQHRVAACPACQPKEYMQRRVVKAVGSALKRMGMQKTQPILTYLGADSWAQVLGLLDAKRDAWNLQNPHMPMTLTNIALDHIRPVHAFSSDGVGAQLQLCNHYTNLQPLLHEDNAWKGDHWSAADEAVWHEHIILKTNYDTVYYPQTAPPQPSLLCAPAPPTPPPSPRARFSAPQSET